MQLLLILGIIFAIGAVIFALQNNIPVIVILALWRFESSLAVVLLVAVAIGALIAGLVSTPSVIRGQWAVARLRRQVAALEEEKTVLERRVHDFESAAAPGASPTLPPEEPAPYVGLKTLLMAHE